MSRLLHSTCLVLMLSSLFGGVATAQEKKPNVVVIMVDNHGWGELGCYGGAILRGAETPRLDEFASESTSGVPRQSLSSARP